MKLTKTTKKVIKNYKWIILLFSIICFLIILIDVKKDFSSRIDSKGYSIISSYLINDKVTPVVKVLTNLGGTIWLIVCSISIFIAVKNKKVGFSIILNLALAALTNFTIKQIIQRPRPTGYRIIEEWGYSFPSGHSMVSISFYGYLIYRILKSNNKTMKRFLIPIFSLLVISIGISRIYLGVHYTSDVLGGFLCGVSYLIIFTNFIDNFIDDKESEK